MEHCRSSAASPTLPIRSELGRFAGPGVAGMEVFPLVCVSTGWAQGYDWTPAEK